MPNVFISYRRIDSQAMTDRIYDHMAGVFGKAHVFQDVFDIDYGEDFRKVIEKQVSTCDVMLVVIGTQWLTVTEKDGARRLDNPHDSVRIEVETGLRNPRTRVIPVLVNGASMPPVDQLPESLRELSFRNGVEVRHNPYFDEDVRRLAARLQHRSPLRIALIATGVLVIAAIIAALTIPPYLESLNAQATGTAVAALTLTAPTNTETHQPTATITPTLTVTVPSEAQSMIALAAFSLYESASETSLILTRINAGTPISVSYGSDPAWVQVTLENGTIGYTRAAALRAGTPTPRPGGTPIAMSDGYGARSDAGWQVYFTEPLPTELAPPSDCDDPASLAVVGIPARLADAIDQTVRTLDIASFQIDQCLMTQVIEDAHARGVIVRIVTDDEYGLANEDSTLNRLVAAGIPVITDDRSTLMHNSFMILDQAAVWTGSWDFTYNDTFRNTNNTLVFTAPETITAYQAEFDEMFVAQSFGSGTPTDFSTQSDANTLVIQPLFGPEDELETTLLDYINGAQQSIDFMMFSYTLDSVEQAMIAQSNAGVRVRGLFEATGSETDAGALRPLFCAAVDVRQDGGRYFMHHKVIIIDGAIVLTASMNLSSNAISSNDENLVIIRDPNLAAEYLAEMDRQWALAHVPAGITCE